MHWRVSIPHRNELGEPRNISTEEDGHVKLPRSDTRDSASDPLEKQPIHTGNSQPLPRYS